MKKSRFKNSQIMDALKRVEVGLSVLDLCRELGISSPTFYKWGSRFGGMDTSLMARMKELEIENARLKKMYAEERLTSEIQNEAITKKWYGHLAYVRWPSERYKNDRLRYGWLARSSL